VQSGGAEHALAALVACKPGSNRMSHNQNERLRAIELVIAFAVVVICVASLFTAVYQAVVMRQTLEAPGWRASNGRAPTTTKRVSPMRSPSRLATAVSLQRASHSPSFAI